QGPAPYFDPEADIDDRIFGLVFAAGQLVGLKNRDDFFDAGNRGQRRIADGVFFADHSDNCPLDAPADVGPQPHFMNMRNDVVDLFLGRIRFDDDNHSTGSLRGYEPSTSSRTALFSNSASMRLVRASPAWPSNSRKKRYPTS